MKDWHEIGKASLSSTAVCAGVSSALTKTILFPMDTVKCRLIANGHMGSYRGIFNGLIPKIALYAPYQSVYMTTYTAVRDLGNHGPLGFVLAGVSAELAGSFIRVPMEAVKQQMQAGIIKSNKELVSMIRENPLRFYKKRNFLAQTLVHDIPCGAVHWVVYEWVRRDQGRSSWVAGAFAGATAAIVTNPLDVVKTRMITRPAEHLTVRSTVNVLLRQGGPSIFLTGLIPRILHLAPNSALYMFLFDKFYRISLYIS